MMPVTFVSLTLILKRILKALKIIFEGSLLGLAMNFAWHYFLAVNLDWGDSAPDWYFRIQETVFIGILLIGLIGWAIVGSRLDACLNRRKI
jgi:hypothetical protein